MNTSKLLPWARVDPGFGERAKFMASAECEPIYIGHLGAVPQWCPVAISPWWGQCRGKAPEADEFTANEI